MFTSLGGRAMTLRTSPCSSHDWIRLGAERRGGGVLLGHVGGDLDAVPNLAVDLDDHRHRVLAGQLRVGLGHAST